MSHSGYTHEFTMSAQANDREVRALLCNLRRQLADHGVAEPTCASAELVLAEALNNVTEHAYSGLPEGPVELRTEIGAAMLRFTLSDHGNALPGNRLPAGNQQDMNVAVEDLPEGGFGWLIIHAITSSIRYDRKNDENCLVMTIPNALNG